MLVLAVCWFALRLSLAQWLLDDVLEGGAPPGTTASVAELTPGHAVLTDVAIPGLGRVAKVILNFTVGGLLDGRVDSVTLDRPAFSVALDENGQPVEPLRSWLAGDGAGNSPLPLAHVALERASLRLESPLTWANVSADGSYDLTDRDTGQITFTVSTSLGDLQGHADLNGWAGQTTQHACITFEASRLGVAGAQADGIAGHADITLGERQGALLSLQAETTELDGHALGPLVLSGTWGADKASLDFDIGDGEGAATAHLTAGYDGQATTWSVAGLLSVARDLELPLPSPLLVSAPTRIEIDLAGAVPEFFDASHLEGGGTMTVESAGLSTKAFVAGPITLPLNLALAEGTLTLSLDAPASIAGLAGGTSPPAWMEALPPRFYALTIDGGGLQLAVTSESDGAYALKADLAAVLKADDGFSAQADAGIDLRINADGTPVGGGLRHGELVLQGPLLDGIVAKDLSLSGQALLSDGKLQATADVEGKLTHIAIAGLVADGVTLALPLRFEQESNARFRATVEPVAVLGADRLSFQGITVDKLLAELPLTLAYEDDALSVTLAEAGWVDIGALRHASFRTVGNTSFKLTADMLPLLTLRDLHDVPSWDARLVLDGADATIEVLDSEHQVAATVSGTLPGLRLSAGRLGAVHIQSTAETHGGDLTVAGPDIAVSGLELLLNYNDGLSPWPQIAVNGLNVRDLLTPKRFVPLRIDIALKPVGPQGRDARVSLDLHLADQRYAANVEASWEPDSERLSAYLRMPPLRFSPQLQPRDLSPLYGSLLTEASGAVEVVGALGLDHGDPFADFDVILDNLSGTLMGAQVEQLAGSIHISDLAPLRTPPGQKLTALRIDPGLPMENLALAFTLPGNGALWLSQATLDFAGGHVSARATTLDSTRAQNRITLDVTGVELARLSALLEMPELEASGALSGQIPVLLEDNDLAIEGGRLATDAPGVLRYIPEGGAAVAGGDENMEMVVTALSNFQYQSIVIDLDRALGGASIVGLHIAGANPELYGGYPIELNVNLTGDLDRIVRDSLAGWRIPEDIRKRLSGF